MTWLFLALHLLLIAGFGLRILLRDDVRPDVRMGWLTVIVLLPYASCALYYLFGEVTLRRRGRARYRKVQDFAPGARSEEHTSELQSQSNLVCRLLLEKKKISPGTASHLRPLTYLL